MPSSAAASPSPNSETAPTGLGQTRVAPREWLLIGILTAGCLASVLAAWWYYATQARELEAARTRTIFAVAEGKSRQIANWRAERTGDGNIVASASNTAIAGRILSSHSTSAADPAVLRDLFGRFARSFLYADAMLVEPDGIERLHLFPDKQFEFDRSARTRLAANAIDAGGVVLSDLTGDTVSRKPFMAVTIPIGRQGAAILEIDPARFLYPYLAAWPGGAATAETLLVERDGNAIVDMGPKRYAPRDSLFRRRLPSIPIPPDASLEAGVNIDTADYRGVRSIGTARHIPGSPWYVICKMDWAEAVAPTRRLAVETLLLSCLFALANGFGGFWIVRSRRYRVHREREALFYAIANETPALLWVEPARGGVRFMNRPLREFLGDAGWWTDCLDPDDRDRVRALHDAARGGAEGYSAECAVRRADGAYRKVAIEALPQPSANGIFTGFAGSLSDVTGRRKAEEHLRIANASLERELAERTRKQEEIRSLSARLIEAREEERARLARELHDGLNQQIAAISIALANLRRSLPTEQTETREEAERIRRKLIQLADDIRALSHELHPALLALQGLGPALESYCREFSRSVHIPVSVSISGSIDDLTPAVGLSFYRIVQEGLQNVAKHSRAGSARVDIDKGVDIDNRGTLRLRIADTGIGFDMAKSRAAGLGLISMEERVRLTGGKFSIESAPGQGTVLSVEVALDSAS